MARARTVPTVAVPATALAGVLVVLTLLVGTGWGPLLDLDHAVARRAFDATSGHPGPTAAWLAVTTWGRPQVARLAMLAGAVALGAARRWSLALWLVVLALVEGVVAPESKLVLGRPRPHWPDPITTAGSTSFPSGHATAAFTAAVAALLLARRLGRGPWPRVVLPGLAVLAAVAVAASRVFLGVHYLSDVVGGALLGAVLATGTWRGAQLVTSLAVKRARGAA